MTRRLLYHCFWNFYDYLGTYLLLGGGSVLVLSFILFAGAGLAMVVSGGLIQAVIAVLTAGLLVTASAILLAGFQAFATRGAKDEPARLPDFKSGARRLFRPYLKVLFVLFLTLVVVISNVWFYGRIGATVGSPEVRMGLAAASMVFIWGGAALFLYSFVILAVPARFPEDTRLWPTIRRGTMLFALAPGLWLIVAILFTVAAVFCFLSVVGAIFLLPIFGTLTATAMDLVIRMVDDLGKARTELGEGKPLRAYKRRALELGWEYEYRQPRRTLRELIRPWET